MASLDMLTAWRTLEQLIDSLPTSPLFLFLVACNNVGAPLSPLQLPVS